MAVNFLFCLGEPKPCSYSPYRRRQGLIGFCGLLHSFPLSQECRKRSYGSERCTLPDRFFHVDFNDSTFPSFLIVSGHQQALAPEQLFLEGSPFCLYLFFLPIIEHGCYNKLQDNPVEHFLYLLEGLRPREGASLGTWSRLVHFQCIFVKVKQSLLGPNIAPVTQESRWNARVWSSVIDPTSPDLSVTQQGYPCSCLNLVCQECSQKTGKQQHAEWL